MAFFFFYNQLVSYIDPILQYNLYFYSFTKYSIFTVATRY